MYYFPHGFILSKYKLSNIFNLWFLCCSMSYCTLTHNTHPVSHFLYCISTGGGSKNVHKSRDFTITRSPATYVIVRSRPLVSPSPRNVWDLFLICFWDLSQIGMDYLCDVIFKIASVKLAFIYSSASMIGGDENLGYTPMFLKMSNRMMTLTNPYNS